MVTGILKEIISTVIRFSGLPFLIRNSIAKNKVTILFYHDPSPDILDKNLKYLSKRYNFINITLLIEAIYNKTWTNIPKKSLIITLDDGHKDKFKLLKTFKKYKIIPTIYICSQIINTNRLFWFKIVEKIEIKKFKEYTNSKRLRTLKLKYRFTPYKEYAEKERQTLNSKEILQMKDYIDFQSHSCFHPCLPSCTKDECKNEIFKSKSDIESLIGYECEHFCYPNGDYTDREIEIVKDAGYLSARTIDFGWNDLNTNPYKLKAIEIQNNDSNNMLAAKLSCIPAYFRFLMLGNLKGEMVKLFNHEG